VVACALRRGKALSFSPPSSSLPQRAMGEPGIVQAGPMRMRRSWPTSVVGSIGIPLAIELAAGRVDSFGHFRNWLIGSVISYLS